MGKQRICAGTQHCKWIAIGLLALGAHATGSACQSAAITSPANQAVYPAPAALSINAQVVAGSVVDGDGTVINKSVRSIKLYQDGALVSTQTMSSTGTVTRTFPVSNLAAGAHTYYVVGTCNVGSKVSSSITVHSNVAPTVSVTAPAPSSSFVGPASVTLSATANDTGGSVSRVEFYSGSSLIGTATAAPYNVVWGNLGAGNYTFFARVVDNTNTVVDSSAVTFQVTAAPVVRISSPPAGAMLSAATGVTVSGSASIPGSTVTRVDLYSDGALIGTVSPSGSSFSYLWGAATPGEHTLSAMAVSSSGATSPSAAIPVTVVQPTTLIPPNMAGGGVAGSLLGKAAVVSGRASYSVPLVVPPGTRDVVPTVSLEYSSALGPGLLGTGWSIGGGSSITRCGATKSQDGVTRGVRLSAEDQFCIDGQRLKLVSGVHGQNARYATEVDRFAKVLSFGSDASKGPDRWEVWSKDGRISHYGSTSDSIVEAQGRSPVVVLTWELSKVQDRRGNYVSYSYAKDSSEGAHWPVQIAYTGTVNGPPYNAVRFEYDDRSDLDRIQGYVYGSKVSTIKRLRNIKTYVNISADGQGGTLVRDLRVGYIESSTSGRSLVSTLSDCNAEGSCLPATTFGWSQRTATHNNFDGLGSGDWGGPTIAINWPILQGSTPDQIKAALSREVTAKTVTGDFNGDGRLDLATSTAAGVWKVCLSTGQGFNCADWAGSTISPDSSFPGDFNGDGRTDIAQRRPQWGNGATTWEVCLSTGSGFNCGNWAMYDIPVDNDKYLVGDFDGDGRDDIVLGETNYAQKLCVSTGSATSGFICSDYANAAAAIAVSYDPAMEESSRSAVPTVVDFDGDGRGDVFKVMYLGSLATPSIWHATPTGFELVDPSGSTSSGSTAGAAAQITFPAAGGTFFADHNSDGAQAYPDSLIAYPNKTNPSLSGIRYCQFKGALGSHCIGLSINSTSVDDFRSETFSDVDGDRRPDSIHWDQTRGVWRVCQLSVTGSFTCADWGNSVNPNNFTARFFGDFNGDGKIDLALYDRATGRWTVRLANGPNADLLVNVVDGNALETQFTYRPLTDPSVYIKDSGALASQLPIMDLQTPDSVVSQLRTSNAKGGWLTTDFSYQGLKADLGGRGTLGFRVQWAVDASSGILTEDAYLQDFPLTGLVSSHREISSAGVELVRTSNQYAVKTSSVGLPFPVLTSQVEDRRELDGSATTSTSTLIDATSGYDTFGNVLLRNESAAADGSTFTATTSSTYDNDDATWLIGRLRLQTITKTAPSGEAVSRKTELGYNATGELAYAVIEPDDPALRVRTDIGASDRDAVGNVLVQRLSWIDPRTGSLVQRIPETASWEPGRGRFKLRSENALGQRELFDYSESHGGLLARTSINDQVTHWSYDGWGRRSGELRPDGTSTSWSFKPCTDGCNGGYTAVITQYWHGPTQISVPLEDMLDGLGRQVRHRTWAFDGTELRTDQIFNEIGQLQYTSKPYKVGDTIVWTGYTFDVLNRARVIAEVGDDGVSRNTLVNYSGRTEFVENAKHQTTTKRLNAIGKIDRVTDAAQKVTTYLYDPFGNLKRVTDPLQNQINIGYDRLGRKTSLIDPDLGSWQFFVDPIGQNWRKRDSYQRNTDYWYDDLGRLVRRVAVDEEARFVFDTAPFGKGKLASASTLDGGGAADYVKTVRYDELSRPSSQTITLDQDYVVKYSYGVDGRLESQRHERNSVGGSGGPGVTFSMGYNGLGYLAEVRTTQSDGSSDVSWVVQQRDGFQNVTQSRLGNGLVTRNVVSPATGRLKNVYVGNSATDSSIQEDSYQYDEIGNLNSRSQRSSGSSILVESFTHDPLLNVVKTATIAGQPSKTFIYDDLGNILSKSDVGTYSYPASGTGAVRPHAPTSIQGAVNGIQNPSFSYDDNGNLLSGGGRVLTWKSFNRPLTVSAGGTTSTFAYGPDYERARQTIADAGGTTNIYYAQAIEKEVKGGSVVYRTYMPFGLGYVEESNGTSASRYFHRDLLGSVHATTNGAQALIGGVRFSYDVWGKRRGADGGDDLLNALRGGPDHQGYTRQEHLDGQTLIHFNARIYDPVTARFLSPDPTVPELYELAQLNRYSYVVNRPLFYIDPTGFDLEKVVITCNWICRYNPGIGYLENHAVPVFARLNRVVRVAAPQVLRLIGKKGAQALVMLAVPGVGEVAAVVNIGSGVVEGVILLSNVYNAIQADADSSSGDAANGADTAGTPPGGPDDDGDPEPKRVTNPKHHPNSKSPEPKNVDQLYENSVVDKNGVRWAKDADGTVHRFSKPSNGETHWNGSTGGVDPIQPQNIPVEIRRLFGVKG